MKLDAKMHRLATADILRRNPDLSGADLEEAVQELLEFWKEEHAQEQREGRLQH